MKFLTRLFRSTTAPPPIPTVEPPVDGHLREEIKDAKRENSRAVNGFLDASQKQERSVLFARQVIADVINRAEKVKAVHHAGIKK